MSVSGTVGVGGLPVPIGSIIPFITEESFPTEVDGWLLCDGSIIDADDFPDLFDVIGNNYDQAPPVAGLFQLPELNITGESYLTGSLVTNGTKQIPSVTGGSAPKLLTSANIPTLKQFNTYLDTTFVTITGTEVLSADAISNTTGDPVQTNCLGASVATGTPAYATVVNNTPTLTYTNASPSPLPDSQYTSAGLFYGAYVSVCYFIKARYFLPPIIPPFVQVLPLQENPPTSGIYNDCNSLSGFIYPLPTYSTGF